VSEFKLIETEFKDGDVLVESLKEMGYNPEIHETPVNLYGYKGDKRQQKAHIVIPRRQVGAASNDVGFEKVGDKYKLHASQFDSAWREGIKIKKLKMTYSEKKVMKIVKKTNRFSFKSRQEKEGKIKIKINVR